MNCDGDTIVGKEGRDGFAPLDDNDIGWTTKFFLQVFGHEAGIGETIKVVMDETIAAWQSVGFGDGEAGASDGFSDAEALR